MFPSRLLAVTKSWPYFFRKSSKRILLIITVPSKRSLKKKNDSNKIYITENDRLIAPVTPMAAKINSVGILFFQKSLHLHRVRLPLDGATAKRFDREHQFDRREDLFPNSFIWCGEVRGEHCLSRDLPLRFLVLRNTGAIL